MNSVEEAKERAALLLQEMSLEEKMAQTRCAFPGTGKIGLRKS